MLVSRRGEDRAKTKNELPTGGCRQFGDSFPGEMLVRCEARAGLSEEPAPASIDDEALPAQAHVAAVCIDDEL